MLSRNRINQCPYLRPNFDVRQKPKFGGCNRIRLKHFNEDLDPATNFRLIYADPEHWFLTFNKKKQEEKVPRLDTKKKSPLYTPATFCRKYPSLPRTVSLPRIRRRPRKIRLRL
jgi:hypothetical protein